MKTTLITFLVLITLATKAQDRPKSQGIVAPVNYYDSAMLKKKAGDHCGYCAFLMQATLSGNSFAAKQYRDDCVKIDTIQYPADPANGSQRYSTITDVSCTGQKDQSFHIKEPGKTGRVSFIVLGPDGEVRTDQFKEFPMRETDQHRFIYLMPEEMCGYKGGDEARIKFLQQNIRYPEEAKVTGQQGKVFTTFIVNENGTISGLKILKGVSRSLDNEALRVIGMMPPWIPGKVKGKPVKCQFVLPIKFALQ